MHPVYIQNILLADTLILYIFEKILRFMTMIEKVRKTEISGENG